VSEAPVDPPKIVYYHNRPWALVWLRNGRRPTRTCYHKGCLVELLPGQRAYRPLHNGVGRWARLCAGCGAKHGKLVP
jgi:hypothetical protein